jgi:hypothetical protein
MNLQSSWAPSLSIHVTFNLKKNTKFGKAQSVGGYEFDSHQGHCDFSLLLSSDYLWGPPTPVGTEGLLPWG